MNKFNINDVDETKEALKPHISEMVFELDYHAYSMLKSNKLDECVKLKKCADELIENNDLSKVKHIISLSNKALDEVLKKDKKPLIS